MTIERDAFSLKFIDEALFEEFSKGENLKKYRDLPEEEVQSIVQTTIDGTVRDCLADLQAYCEKNRSQYLAELNEQRVGFEDRNIERWKPALDLLEIMIVVASEVSLQVDIDYREEAIKKDDATFECLTHLVPRGILIANEVIALMRAGFADGALARWRSLHEVLVTAAFIAENDAAIAKNYLARLAFNAWRAATQYNEYADRAGLVPLTSQDLNQFVTDREAAKQFAGRDIGAEFDWAKPAINEKRITLFDLEKHVGLDHWRPRYRWASQHIHASHRAPSGILGMTESSGRHFLVGASNSGMTDPLQYTAITLSNLVAKLLNHNKSVAAITYMQYFAALAKRVGETAFSTEQETRAKHHGPQT